MTVYSIDWQIFGHFLPPLSQIFNQIQLFFTEIIATHSNLSMKEPSVAKLGLKMKKIAKNDQILRKIGLLRQIWAN